MGYTIAGQRGTKGSEAPIARDVLEDRYLLGTLVSMYHVEDVTSSTRRQQMIKNMRRWRLSVLRRHEAAVKTDKNTYRLKSKGVHSKMMEQIIDQAGVIALQNRRMLGIYATPPTTFTSTPLTCGRATFLFQHSIPWPGFFASQTGVEGVKANRLLKLLKVQESFEDNLISLYY